MSTAITNRPRRGSEPLAARRLALLARIQVERSHTAQIGRLLAEDLHVTARRRHSIHAGWKLLKASAVAAGVVWSFNASSKIGRGRRLFTIAVSVLSTLRAMRKMRSFMSPISTFPTLLNRQETPS